MSSYRSLPNMGSRGYMTGSYSFIFIAIAIILVFVVLYYSYNFLFSTIGVPVPAVIILNAQATTGPLTPKTTSFTAPYEGGDFTVTFWLYMAENSLAGGNANYRKHIIDIGGNSFSTFAIGIDAGTNNLIVRTHTGGTNVTGTSSTTSVATNSGTTSNSGSPNYVTYGGQTFYGGLNGATYPCYSVLGQLSSLIAGSSDCIASMPTVSSSIASKCTSAGRLDRAGNNIGWDKGCNPCDGYWVPSATGTGGTNGGTNGSTNGSSSEDYITYTGPCRSCMWSCDGTFSGAERRNGGTGGTGGTGSPGGTSGSANCTWSRTTATYSGCGSGSSVVNTNSVTTSSSTPTVSLGTTTIDSLFNSVAVSSTDLAPTPCDAPGIDLQRWTHITTVFSGKITDVYMNGKLARSCIGASYFKVDASPIKINLLRYGKYFNGKIANLNLYTVALNPAQIYDMYTKGPTT